MTTPAHGQHALDDDAPTLGDDRPRGVPQDQQTTVLPLTPPPPPEPGTRVGDEEHHPSDQYQSQGQSQDLSIDDDGPTLLPPTPVQHPSPVEVTELDADWHALQSRFVDDPQDAVSAAADLVDRAIADLRSSLTDSGDDDRSDTERLRIAFKRYREVHEALTTL